MADLRVLLARPKRAFRRRRNDLIQFADSLLLHLSCGFDFAHSWDEAVSSLPGSTRSLLARTGGAELPLSSHLAAVAERFPAQEMRHWFTILQVNYASGSPLIPLVKSLSDHLRREQLRDFDQHTRTLPTRTNILLLVFFLPPALIMLFGPLLAQLN